MSDLDDLVLPSEIPPALLPTWEEFRRGLRFRAPGVVEFVEAERWRLNDDFDPEDELDLARIAVLALLVPGLANALGERADEDPDDEDGWEAQTLRGFERLGLSPRSRADPTASFEWVINGLGIAWDGRVEFWQLAADWRAVTATYDRESLGDYLPMLLGFVRDGADFKEIIPLVYSTFGYAVGRPDRISWTGLTARQAILVASGMGGRESLLDRLDDQEVLDWSEGFGTNGSLSLGELEISIGAEQRVRNLLLELERRFSETMSHRRTRLPGMELATDPRVDSLSAEENEFLTRWFDHHRLQRLHAIHWQPHGLKYRTRDPVVLIAFADGTPTAVVPFPQASDAPSLKEVLAKLPPKTDSPGRVPGESDLAFADYLWARGFQSEASALYQSASLSQHARTAVAAAGHYIFENRFPEAEGVLRALVARCEASRQAASQEVNSAKREAMFAAMLAVERDAQRALIVLYQRAAEIDKARAAFERWRLLVSELGEGQDPFAVP